MAAHEPLKLAGEGSSPSPSSTLDDQLEAWEKRMEKRKEEEKAAEEEAEKKRVERDRQAYTRRRGGTDPELGGTGDMLRRTHRAMVDPASKRQR